MNSNKWREVYLTKETVLDIVAAHLYNMRSMDRRDITEITIPSLMEDKDGMIPIKLKMKEVKTPVDQTG